MSQDFNHRFTHALLIGIMAILTREETGVWSILHVPVLISVCFVWAWGLPLFYRWFDRKNAEQPPCS